MRYLVNGVEADLEPNDQVQVTRVNDLLYVRTVEGTSTALVVKTGDKTLVSLHGRTYEIEKHSTKRSKKGAQSNGEIRAPMPGQIVEVFVEQGIQVELGQKLMVVEAMKMQLTLNATANGTLSKVLVQKGQQVIAAQLLAQIEIQNEHTGDAI